MLIHPTSIISSKAQIGNNVKIGPFCVIGDNVILRDNVELKSHVSIDGKTDIDEGTVIFPFASIGQIPQDLKYAGEDSCIKIGKRNSIREYVTIQPGTANGRMETIVGDDCLLMIGTHVAHDCVVGNHVIIANNGTFGGHVSIGDYAVIGGLSAIHQFVRIGEHAMIGGMTGITKDVIPYAVASGNRAELSGINLVGLKRRGFSREDIADIKSAYDILFSNPDNSFNERVKVLEEKFSGNISVEPILKFLKSGLDRQFCILE